MNSTPKTSFCRSYFDSFFTSICDAKCMAENGYHIIVWNRFLARSAPRICHAKPTPESQPPSSRWTSIDFILTSLKFVSILLLMGFTYWAMARSGAYPLDRAYVFFLYATAITITMGVIPGKEPKRLSAPPTWGLRRFAETCFSKKTFAQVLEPTLCDMQKEHFDALAEGCLWKARMALVRGYASFWSAVAAQAPLSVLSLLYKVWKTTKIGS